jgi:hypothetical protein
MLSQDVSLLFRVFFDHLMVGKGHIEDFLVFGKNFMMAFVQSGGFQKSLLKTSCIPLIGVRAMLGFILQLPGKGNMSPDEVSDCHDP